MRSFLVGKFIIYWQPFQVPVYMVCFFNQNMSQKFWIKQHTRI